MGKVGDGRANNKLPKKKYLEVDLPVVEKPGHVRGAQERALIFVLNHTKDADTCLMHRIFRRLSEDPANDKYLMSLLHESEMQSQALFFRWKMIQVSKLFREKEEAASAEPLLVDEPGESLHTSFEELQRGDPGERIRQQMEEFEEFRKGK